MVIKVAYMPGFAEGFPSVVPVNSHYNSLNDSGNIIMQRIALVKRKGLGLNLSSLMPKSVFLTTMRRDV